VNDVNLLRRITEYNGEVILFKKKYSFFPDPQKLKQLLLKYEQNSNFVTKYAPSIDFHILLLHPKDKILDEKKADIAFLRKYIYKEVI
jgi:hypothetical protein